MVRRTGNQSPGYGKLKAFTLAVLTRSLLCTGVSTRLAMLQSSHPLMLTADVGMWKSPRWIGTNTLLCHIFVSKDLFTGRASSKMEQVFFNEQWKFL